MEQEKYVKMREAMKSVAINTCEMIVALDEAQKENKTAIPVEYINRVMAHWKEYESEWYGFWWEALDRLVKGWLEKENEVSKH